MYFPLHSFILTLAYAELKSQLTLLFLLFFPRLIMFWESSSFLDSFTRTTEKQLKEYKCFSVFYDEQLRSYNRNVDSKNDW